MMSNLRYLTLRLASYSEHLRSQDETCAALYYRFLFFELNLSYSLAKKLLREILYTV